MNPLGLLLIYAALVAVASFSGGWVPLVVKLTHRRMQVAISFVAGIILGIGLLHMVPHSFHELGSIDRTMTWVVTGFLFMFILERFFHFHHHDVAETDLLLDRDASTSVTGHDHSADHANDHAHAHDHGHSQAHQHSHHGATNINWLSAAIGLTLHALVDGVAIAAAVKAEDGNDMVKLAGLGVFLAVFLHKPFDSLTIGTLMAAAGRSPGGRKRFNAIYALTTPLGMALFYVLSAELVGSPQGLGQVLGFAGGAFICIATSDLLPELQFHRHDRALLTSALVIGILLAWSTIFLEGEHSHGAEHAHGIEHAHTHGDEHEHPHEHSGEHPREH